MNFLRASSRLQLIHPTFSCLRPYLFAPFPRGISYGAKYSSTSPPFQLSTSPTNYDDDSASQINFRSDPLLNHVTNMIMSNGKKARARSLLRDTLKFIQVQTHSDPVKILYAAIAQVSPLIKVISKRKGIKVIQVPRALNERQSRHRAIKWLLEASNSRAEKDFGVRFGMEILGVINGISKVLEKKEQMHKLGVTNRANLPVKW